MFDTTSPSEQPAEIGRKPGPGGARPGAGRKPRPKPAALPEVEHPLAWYCVRTDQDGERRAAIEIGLAGFDVFSPMLCRPGRAGRRYSNGIVTPARPATIVPLFRRYVFARFSRSEPGWKKIWRMVGVDMILSHGEIPTAVPDTTISLVKALCSENDCIFPQSHAAPLPVGTNARLLDGPLRELTGVVQMSGGRRVRLLLHLLGQAVPVTVSRTLLEAV